MSDNSTLPNILANDNDKDSIEFGLKFMRSVYERWKSGGTESASDRKGRYEYNRLFAQGKQPMEEYKDILDLDGELSVINLAYDPLPIAVPFLNRLFDRYLQRIEKIQCNAIDPFTQNKKDKAKFNALFKMKNKEAIEMLQSNAGLELEEFKDTDPKDEHELEIEFGFNYKEREEVIMEQGIDLVFYDNGWSDVIKKRILYDFVTAGLSRAKPYIDPNGRIKIRFTKPENIITSYSEWEDFRDAQYDGEVYSMKISDIRLKYPKAVRRIGGEEALFKLAKARVGKNGNPSTWNVDWSPSFNQPIARPYDSFTIDVVDVSLKTLYNLKYQVSTDRYGKQVLDKTKKINPEKEYLQSEPYEVEYTGVWICDSEHVLEWGLAKNMVKPQNNLTEIRLPGITFMPDNNKMTNTPLIETMIPSIKKMQLIDLQQQKIIAAAAPDGFEIDISTMSDISLGEGVLENLTPIDLYKIYRQTGIKYYKRLEDDGEGVRQAPIQASQMPYSNKLEQLMGVWNQEYDKLLRIVGSNPLDNGQFTNQAVGKGVLQDARQMSESSSNYLYQAYLNMYKRTAYIVMIRLWDILVHGKKFGIKFYDGYRQALGTDRIEYIRVEATDDFEKTQFDVKIEAVIDDKEAMFLEQNIAQSLAQKEVTLQDAIDVRLLAKSNVKYASYMLASRLKKRREEAIEEARINSESNTQQAIAATVEKSKGDIKLEILKSKLKSKEKKEEIEAEKSKEIIKFNSILKSKMVEGILGQEGKTVDDIPAWVFDGLALANKSQQQILGEAIESTLQEEDEELAMMEQQAEMQAQQEMGQQMEQAPMQ